MRIAKLGELTKIKTGKLDANASVEGGRYPFFTCSIDPLSIDSYSYDCECVLLAGNGDLNVKYYEGRFDAYQRTYIIESEDRCSLDTRYLYYFLTQYVQQLRDSSIGAVIKYIKKGDLTEAVIPLPEITIQKRIICNLDLVIKLLDKEKKKEKYFDELVKSRFVEMFSKYELGSCEIGNLLSGIQAGTNVSGQQRPIVSNEFAVLKISAVTQGWFNSSEYKVVDDVSGIKMVHPRKGDLLFSRANTQEMVGATAIVDDDYDWLFLPDKLWRLDLANGVSTIFMKYLLSSPAIRNEMSKVATGTSGSMKNISMAKFCKIPAFLPDSAAQTEFADFVNRVDKLKFDLGICLFILREETFRLSG